MTWPEGARSAGVACGIKPGGERDLGLLVLDRPSSWAGTFTRNAAAAAPVHWSRSRLGTPARALVVNSGNANACTGSSGAAAAREEADAVARHLSCHREEVLVASTGPIGVRLPVRDIVMALPTAVNALEADVGPFSESILTTDTRTKVARVPCSSASVVGVAKGAAMLAPNMATMLAFLVTDAAVDPATLQKVADSAVDASFNRISVDACESTNDSVFIFATGTAGDADVDALGAATTDVCRDLATKMVEDAEGASKLVRIRVEGSRDDRVASALGRGIASSVLWRAAVFGNDPNWGRVLAALGAVDRTLDLATVSVAIGDAVVFDKGEPVVDLAAARRNMEGPEVVVVCDVGGGPGAAEVLTADLTPDYVSLNAIGTT
ncbi:MAG: bifunctional glutamate N-acetyltransferase/amino-acid acetyltransferase ArgJ [Actinobacteria bacterium]|nr:bifunctional glutamate N-acetyltransferase/amino-acid acetyltransferase ArgJ [Actinomycetota bacterium]